MKTDEIDKTYQFRFDTVEEAAVYGDKIGKSYIVVKLDGAAYDDKPFMYVAQEWLDNYTVIKGDKSDV